MMDLSSLLMSLAEMSHVASLVSVLTGFVLMTLITLRLVGQDWLDQHHSGVTRVTHRPAMVDFRPTAFRCWIKSIASATNEKVRIAFGHDGPSKFTVRCFWGVSIESFHHILASPWPWFIRTFETPGSNIFGSEGCFITGETITFHDGHEEMDLEESGQVTTKDITLERPSELLASSEYSGPAPRKNYPLVLVAVSPAEDSSEESREEALMVAVHLQDSVCQISTHALATFVKNGLGQCTRMVPMFSQSDSECVVCQENKVTRCILPCRHACVCGVCFDQLKNRCPLCRTFITSYFLVDSDPPQPADSVPPGGSSTNQSQSSNLVRRIVRAFSLGGAIIRENE